MTESAFWDASGLTLLCVEQKDSPRARALRSRFPRFVVSWATRVEVTSAVERLQRSGHTDASGRRSSLARLSRISTTWDEVAPDDRIRDLGSDLLSRNDLRAADAMQLAAALLVVRERPRHRPFVVFDVRLATAARREGFSVFP